MGVGTDRGVGNPRTGRDHRLTPDPDRFPVDIFSEVLGPMPDLLFLFVVVGDVLIPVFLAIDRLDADGGLHCCKYNISA